MAGEPTPVDDEELDERLEFDMGEPSSDAPTDELDEEAPPDDLGRGAD
jgi:hypothetical protein